ncbi:type II CAAX endopeptidase family protein [Dokdonia sp.]|uniref:CPBP family intramembrane glutamic endopeptidase n=1 Tax=Dokdonia sp. TaxID=2024995 RepID=UPI003264F8DB
MNILKAILATILYIIVIELIGSWFYIIEVFKIEDYLNYYLLIQGTLQLLIVLLYLYFIRRYKFKRLIRKTHYKWYLFAFIIGNSFVFVQTPLKWVYNSLFNTAYYITYNFDGLSNLLNINYIAIILLIPIGEELFFRDYIQKNLQSKTFPIVAILTASILFAFIHAPYLDFFSPEYLQDWHLFYLTFFGGLLSGILYYKSKSLGPSIIFHIFWNLMATIM